jgi:hypothetical protein
LTILVGRNVMISYLNIIKLYLNYFHLDHDFSSEKRIFSAFRYLKYYSKNFQDALSLEILLQIFILDQLLKINDLSTKHFSDPVQTI